MEAAQVDGHRLIFAALQPRDRHIAFLPSSNRSSALVLVDRQQVPEAFVRPTVTSGLETRLQTISQEVFSRAVSTG